MIFDDYGGKMKWNSKKQVVSFLLIHFTKKNHLFSPILLKKKTKKGRGNVFFLENERQRNVIELPMPSSLFINFEG